MTVATAPPSVVADHVKVDKWPRFSWYMVEAPVEVVKRMNASLVIRLGECAVPVDAVETHKTQWWWNKKKSTSDVQGQTIRSLAVLDDLGTDSGPTPAPPLMQSQKEGETSVICHSPAIVSPDPNRSPGAGQLYDGSSEEDEEGGEECHKREMLMRQEGSRAESRQWHATFRNRRRRVACYCLKFLNFTLALSAFRRRMEPFPTHTRQHHGHDGNPPAGRRGTFKNKTWVSGERSNSGSPFQAGHLGADAPRWERATAYWRCHMKVEDDAKVAAVVDGTEPSPIDEPVLETPEERERLSGAREAERKRAIAEGKMDDPLVPKRLDEAITMVGTCMDMCPRFERYRRERLNNLFNWEFTCGRRLFSSTVGASQPEGSALDSAPSIIFFVNVLPREGFSPTFDFIRDRSRAVRNDFTMQHETGPLAIECHERCARFHILALHFERDRPGFSIVMEEQQLMMIHVQAKSSPISKTSPLIVDEEGMLQFSGLAAMLQEQGSRVMVYLVACILERLFGKDTIEDIEAIRDGISIPDIIDGVLTDDE
ncbi:hypothetical protein F5888DRAFT_1639207, partial [Russula emetica]